MSHPWPDEDPVAAQLGEVFEQAMHPQPTLDETMAQLQDLALKFRWTECLLPEDVEVRVQRVERMAASAVLAHHERACPWLRAHIPLPAGKLDAVIEHWRTCAVCQEVARPRGFRPRNDAPDGPTLIDRFHGGGSR